jgi:hypothetical protein
MTMREHQGRSSMGRLGLAAVAWACLAADAPPQKAMLRLTDGGFVAGELKGSDKPGSIRWESPAFAKPLEFPLDHIGSVIFPLPATPPKPAGDLCFELAGGDVVFGSLAGLDADSATIETARLGRLKVARAKLHRISRWRDGADAVYLGPNGLAGWKVPPRPEPFPPTRVVMRAGGAAAPAAPVPAPTIAAWREEAGQLSTDVEGAAIRSDFELPPRGTIEFELSWTKKPDFILALGAEDTEASFKRAFRIEVWGDDLVAYREGDRTADVAAIRKVGDGPGRVQLQVDLDQPSGRMIVSTPGGKALADLHVPDGASAARSFLRLVNLHGDVRLESLRVGRWDGDPPRDARAGAARIHRGDGSTLYGELLRYDDASKEYIVREDGKESESRVAADKVSRVFLSPPA